MVQNKQTNKQIENKAKQTKEELEY